MRSDSTLSFFDTRPDSVENLWPIKYTAPARKHANTLGWTNHSGSITWDGLEQFLGSSLSKDAVVFLDTSFLDRQDIPSGVFDALLARRLAITPHVLTELQDWIRTPFRNVHFRDRLAAALESKSDSVLLFDPGSWPDGIKATANYYISLLSLRKLAGPILRETLARELGRDLSPAELNSRLQSMVGERGFKLAQKGLDEQGKPNFLADESLVVFSVMYGIITGSETAILSRDRDHLEQLRKFIFLLDTHYRSHLIAKSFSTSPENLIKSKEIKDSRRDYFEPGDRYILDLPRRFTEWVVPKTAQSVSVRCFRLGGRAENMRYANLQFHVQKEMGSLLELKGPTLGKNYTYKDGRNIILTVSPPFAPFLAGRAVVAHDRTITLGGFSGPVVDAEYALQEIQKFRSTKVDLSCKPVQGGTTSMKLVDFFLPQRLTFTSDANVWRAIEWNDLATAFRYFDAAALFFVDRDVIPNLPEGPLTALIERRFTCHRLVHDETLQSGNSLNSAARKAIGTMSVFDPEQSDNARFYGHEYYCSLLAIRRQLPKIIRMKEAPESTDDHIERLAEEYGGIRARRIAERWHQQTADQLVFAGDELAVYSMIASVIEGTDALIVTRDPLFMDQFAKLCYLIRGDYVASQYGRYHSKDRSAFPRLRKQHRRKDELNTAFGRCVYGHVPRGWREGILPRNPFLINIHCWLLGESDEHTVGLSALTFCAERGIHNLLATKASTGGRNVKDGSVMNPRSVFAGDGNCEMTVTFCHDRMIEIGTKEFPTDPRLRVSAKRVAALDISRVHNNDEGIELPWPSE